MKKWLTMAAAVILCLALVIGIACGGEEEEGVETLKYGIGVPLTGFVATVGLAAKYCMEMAAEDIGVFEVAGERYRWKCVYEDNKYSTEGGVASTNKLIFEHNVDFMFQSGDVPGIPAAMITEQIPMLLHIGPGSSTFFGPDLPHTFLSNLCWEITIPVLVDWLIENHPEIKVVVVTGDETATGEASRAVWETVCDYHGLEFNHVVAPTGTVEWYPIATKVRTYEPDLITGSGFGGGLQQVMWEFGYDGMVICNWWEGEASAKPVGWDKLAEKNRFGKGFIVYTIHPYGGVFPRLDAFAEEYEHRSGMEFGVLPAHMMSNLYMLTQALQQAGTVDDLDKIVEAHETGTFDTLVGPMHFGLEEYIGIPHVGVWPVPIFEIVGESEYLVHKAYTAEEVEDVFLEAYGLR